MAPLIALEREPKFEGSAGTLRRPVFELEGTSTALEDPLPGIDPRALRGLNTTADFHMYPEEEPSPIETWEAVEDQVTSLEFLRAMLELEIYSALDASPVEDGQCHGTEDILRRVLVDLTDAPIWLQSLIFERSTPSTAASLIKCLGRLEPPVSLAWRANIIRNALAHSDIEVRDTAVQAVENWKDKELLVALKKHDEKEGWLRDYINRVIRDVME